MGGTVQPTLTHSRATAVPAAVPYTEQSATPQRRPTPPQCRRAAPNQRRARKVVGYTSPTRTCCATTDSTDTSMRLNSSKQPQMPARHRPLKILARSPKRCWSVQLVTTTSCPRVRPRSFTVSVLPVPAGPTGEPPMCIPRAWVKEMYALATRDTTMGVGCGKKWAGEIRQDGSRERTASMVSRAAMRGGERAGRYSRQQYGKCVCEGGGANRPTCSRTQRQPARRKPAPPPPSHMHARNLTCP